MMVHSLVNVSVHLFGGKCGIRTSWYGMKKVLDRYISNHYHEVRAYTLYFLSKMGSNIEADTVINNSYLHVLTINEDSESEAQVKSYLLNTIKYQILWNTSLSHKDDRVTSMEYDGSDEVDNEQDLQAKILEDKIYSTHKSLIEIYRSEIDDHVHRVVFEAYIDKGYITARAMAKYFDIPVTSAHYLIREIKQNLRKLQYRYETISNN
jgi:hypothetical protein